MSVYFILKVRPPSDYQWSTVKKDSLDKAFDWVKRYKQVGDQIEIIKVTEELVYDES